MSAGDVAGAVVRDLWALLDEIQEMGFSFDPRDLVHNIGVLTAAIDRAWTVATDPPPGDPAAIEAAAALWRSAARSHRAQADDLTAFDVASVWHGTAAVACAATVRRLAGRLEDASALADRASKALEDHENEITRARRRHGEVGGHLRAAARRLGRCAPWEIPDMLGDVVEELVGALRAAIESYEIAGASETTCSASLRGISDGMPFPDAVGPGMSAFELMNVLSAARGGRPLLGDVAARAADRYAELGAGAREAVDQVLADAPSPEHRAWVVATLATGAPLETLTNFARHIADLPPSELATVLDPTTVELAQQSSTTCGSASLAVARMLNDPVYALKVLGGYDSVNGAEDSSDVTDRFAAAELETKARTNDSIGTDGEWVASWPDALGTSPWGAAEEMNGVGGGEAYGVALVDSGSGADRQTAYDALERAALDGRPAPLYVGDGTSPRHVVLVVAAGDDALQVYEPGSGLTVTVSEHDFVRGDVDLGGWDRPWAVVTP